MSTRPNRPNALSPNPEAESQDTGVETNTSFEALRSAHDTLVRQRSRLELLHEQAQNEIRACQKEAQKMGVDSIEDLQALIERQEEEDRLALAGFEEAIKAEESLQKRVVAELESS